MADVRVQVSKDGPYVITGPVDLVDEQGEPVEGARREAVIALCRCGGSATKPFCDGTHRKIGFRGEPGEQA